MGLCKCPKKKVTNLFCFEHRVNVCEHCLVDSHSSCVVQSYLQWLQDSDYDPACKLCGRGLSDPASGQCVRLLCYDVFHWQCLNAYAQRMPPNTAPAGYTCPGCSHELFPTSNNASPVAEQLRKLLTQVNWARTGLGLPLVDEGTAASHLVASPTTIQELGPSQTVASSPPPPPAAAAAVTANYSQDAGASTSGYQDSQLGSRLTHSVVNVAADTAESAAFSRHGAGTREPFQEFDVDTADNKYKRRPAMQWFKAWFSTRPGVSNRRDATSKYKRILVLLVLGVLGFITVVLVMSRLGRNSADSDPGLDPWNNPNIRVGE